MQKIEPEATDGDDNGDSGIHGDGSGTLYNRSIFPLIFVSLRLTTSLSISPFSHGDDNRTLSVLIDNEAGGGRD